MITEKKISETYLWQDNEIVNSANYLASLAESCIGLPSITYYHPEQGMSPQTGFDCSGFVTFLLSIIDKRETHIRSSANYAESFGVLVHEPQRGDLVIFSKNGIRPTHIGIMINNTEFVHAPGKQDTQVSVTCLSDYLKDIDFRQHRRYKTYGEPLIYSSPLVCFKRLSDKYGEFKGSIWRKPVQ